MTSTRNILFIALLFIVYLMWMQWEQDYGAPAQAPAVGGPAATTSPATGAQGETPAAGTAPVAATVPVDVAGTELAGAAAAASVVVTTDVLRVEIDPRGGNVVVADLLAYPQQPHQSDHPVRLLDRANATWFVAQSGLIAAQGSAIVAPDHTALYQVEHNAYTLGSAESIEVPLIWSGPGGLSVRKVLTFRRGSYVIEQREEISNNGASAWHGNAYRQLQRVPPVYDSAGIKGYANVERYSFAGAAIYSPADKFEKLKFDHFAKEPLAKSFAGGWAAMLQHYFFAAWIPPAQEADSYATSEVTNAAGTRYLIRAMSPPLTVAPGASATTSARLYVGPKLQASLDTIAPGLALTVDYGMFTVIADPLHWLLTKLHKLTGNWGLAIILLVLLIKALFFKLSEAQYRSSAKMRKLQPRLAALKERYGDDRQKFAAAQMELFQKEKVNPLAGCLPMLIQIPVFFALYWVLLESVELRQASFVGWLNNLSAPDPYYVLPVLNAIVMVATQHLTPMTGMDPTQARMMKIMPVVFSVLFAFFPAGLVLYYVVNGGLGLLQQWIITRRIERGDKPAAA
ncbi:MAG: membrane protein insertase YidC [Xanthomonadales bacterium]|nr:membrane protein insertase YidC [Xanthomonadales bacterium]MDL1869846.1 membrane protein insertase YidC [Gammaproteobacteria bacterium PRO6]